MLCPNGVSLIAWRTKRKCRITHNDKAFLIDLRGRDALKGRCVKLRQEFDRLIEDGVGACSLVDELTMADVIYFCVAKSESCFLGPQASTDTSSMNSFIRHDQPARVVSVIVRLGIVIDTPYWRHQNSTSIIQTIDGNSSRSSNGDNPEESILGIRVSGWLLNLGKCLNEPRGSLFVGPGSRRAILIQALQEPAHVRLHHLLVGRRNLGKESSR